MEHYRRLGFADEVRAQGLPPDYPTDIAYFTRYTEHELARFSLPSARAATDMIKTHDRLVERGRTATPRLADVRRGRAAGGRPQACADRVDPPRLADEGIAQTPAAASRSRPSAMTAASAARCAPPMPSAPTAAAAPRARRWASAIVGEGAARCAISWAGRCLAIHFRSREALRRSSRIARAWMYWTVNRDRRASMAASTAATSSTFHTQLKAGESRRRHFRRAGQGDVPARARPRRSTIEIIARSSWNAGYTLVAEQFQRGRIFLGGDAAHLFTPTGGLGYNTAVEDAVNLGWKLAAVLKGWGGPALLDSYEIERQALAQAQHRLCARLCRLARPVRAADGDSRTTAPPARRHASAAGDHLNAHARAEFNIPGITFGGRYDGSPIVIADGTAPPPDSANTYVADRLPRRPRAASLARRRPLALRHASASSSRCCGLAPTRRRRQRRSQAAAKALNLPLSIVRFASDEARDLYQADLGADPARPDRGLARPFDRGRRPRAAQSRRTLNARRGLPARRTMSGPGHPGEAAQHGLAAAPKVFRSRLGLVDGACGADPILKLDGRIDRAERQPAADAGPPRHPGRASVRCTSHGRTLSVRRRSTGRPHRSQARSSSRSANLLGAGKWFPVRPPANHRHLLKEKSSRSRPPSRLSAIGQMWLTRVKSRAANTLSTALCESDASVKEF